VTAVLEHRIGLHAAWQNFFQSEDLFNAVVQLQLESWKVKSVQACCRGLWSRFRRQSC